MRYLIFVVLVLVGLENGFCLNTNKDNIIASTEQGDVLGSVKVNKKGGQFYSFMSIPYAKPPVGNLRFKAPVPPDPWNGTLDGTNEPPFCYQTANNMILGGEDCLYLNVYTKTLSTENHNLKPVMFFIHGGGNTEGSSRTEMYGPEFLMTEDIVLVTINYRLHVLGYLSIEDDSLGIPGNAALKDQVLAMKWVNKNIKNFGGNPNLVTIFGESAGAGSVEYHTLSPLSQGLFHRAITQSGSVLNPWATNDFKKNRTVLAHQLGLQTDDIDEFLAALRSLPLEKLHLLYDPNVNEGRQNSAVIESKHEGAFLTEEPRKLLLNGNFSKVPMIIGYTSDEGIFGLIAKGYNGSSYDIDFSEYVPYDLNPNNNTEREKEIIEELKTFYNGRNYSNDKIQEEIDIFTDMHFLSGIHTSVKARLAKSNAPIYFYRFSMNTTLNKVKALNPYLANRTGACHADDLYYLFKGKYSDLPIQGSLEDLCVDKIVKLWTNFAIYGDPTPREQRNNNINVEWPQAQRHCLRFLEIGNVLRVGKDPDKERTDFWSKLYEKYYDH